MHIQQFWKYISILLTSACLICFCSCEKPAKKKRMKILDKREDFYKNFESPDVIKLKNISEAYKRYGKPTYLTYGKPSQLIYFYNLPEPEKIGFTIIYYSEKDKAYRAVNHKRHREVRFSQIIGMLRGFKNNKRDKQFGYLLSDMIIWCYGKYIKIDLDAINFLGRPDNAFCIDNKRIYKYKFKDEKNIEKEAELVFGKNRILTEISIKPVGVISGKSIPELIQDLGVNDEGNHTCNTASALLITRKDEAVPYLDSALSSPNKKICTRAVNVLGSINTKKSRAVLIRAYPKLDEDLRGYIAYILAFWPNKDAEAVYIRALSQKNPWHYQVCIIRAMGEVKSREALPNLREIIAKPNGWDEYYTALCSVRKIKGKELPPKLSEALELLKKAKYNASVNKEQLKSSGKVIMANINLVLPDLLNIYLYVTKGNITDFEPNAKTLLRDAGDAAYPYFAIALKNSSHEYLMNSLIKELGIEGKFK